MTDDEKKRMIASFVSKTNQTEEPDPWTDEELLMVAEKIIKKLGLKEELNRKEKMR